ncbi:MAG: SDR family oxidoreductase [Rhodothermales bacterium]|nr:SDR family oxidoreductase [Rhodothermales bacterium]MCA0267962.1 SDR family oxidoreductase [Bacteroidota bacterium]
MNILQGRIVAITGAGGHLGRVLVRRFVEAGATVVAIVGSEASAFDLPFDESREAWAYVADVTDEAAVCETFDAMAREVGPLDLLVHAVGAWEASPLSDTSLRAWQNQLDVNLTSTFLCFREASKHMVGHGGRLVAFASRQGADRGAMEQAAYSAAKAGVVRLVEAAAQEFQGHITAHAIAPSHLVDEAGEAGGVLCDDVAKMCVALATPLGDAFNGQVLRLYGLDG